ncbi:MAG: VTT domain-containing protein [Phycisphaerales bacterium]|nr:VTT domain-containing protein [Phycisphaerales bacterium]
MLDAIAASSGTVVSLLLFAGFFAITAGLGLLPTYAQAILAGWAFGTMLGTVGAILGILLGAAIGFGLARLISGPAIEGIIRKRPVVAAVRNAVIGSGFFRATYIVGLLRLSPNSPFALSNLALGGARTPAAAYLLGTMLGMLPRTAIAAGIAAAAAADGSRGLIEVVKAKGWPMTITGVAVLVIAILIIGSIGKRALKRALDDQAGAAASS